MSLKSDKNTPAGTGDRSKKTRPSKVLGKTQIKGDKLKRTASGEFVSVSFRHKGNAPSETVRDSFRIEDRDPTARLEARIPAGLYKTMERAAQLRGLTMTAYVTAVMGQDAQRTIEDTFIIKLSADDQTAFAKALIDPPAPNDKLIAAKRRHAAMVK